MADKSQTTEERYFVSTEVEHPCCYEAAVCDRRDMYGPGSYRIVCECTNAEVAKKITSLLNEECARAER